jgi:hypothetical protein
MAKCEIWLELDADRPVFRAGEVLSGTVHVEVDSDCRCDGLDCEIGWYTHGRGNSVEKTCLERRLFTGEWSAGSHVQYPVEFTLPDGPFTYHGHYLNIDWYIWASADIPWALDPKAEQDFVLQPGDSVDGLDYTPTHSALATATPPGSLSMKQGFQAIFGLLVAAIGIIFTVGFVVLGDADGFGIFLFGGISVVAGGAVAFPVVRRMLAEQRLGAVEVELVPQRVPPGSTVLCSVRFTPQRDVHLLGADILFRGREEVVSGSGTNRSTHTHTVHEVRRPLLDGPRDAPAGDFTELSARLEVPADAPLSFAARDNELEWSAEVHVDIDNWPDWKRELPLVVAPPIEADADAATAAAGELPDEDLW